MTCNVVGIYMLGFMILSKVGVLLYKFAFSTEFSEIVDADLVSGVLTAIIDTFGSEIKGGRVETITQADHRILVKEGEHTYGFFFLEEGEEDEQEKRFAERVMSAFENEFGEKIKSNMGIFDREEFQVFDAKVREIYNTFHRINVNLLNEIIPLLQQLGNVILLEPPFYFQVFQAVQNPRYHEYLTKLSALIRYPFRTRLHSIKSQKNALTLNSVTFSFSEDLFVHAENVEGYVVVLLADSKEDIDFKIYEKTIDKIRKKIIKLSR